MATYIQLPSSRRSRSERSNGTSSSSPVARLRKYRSTQTATGYLGHYLPRGWQHFFNSRRAGGSWGLSIVCPHCDKKPPLDFYGYQKWRWLSVHIASHAGSVLPKN